MKWGIPLKRVNKYEVPGSAKITTLKRTLQVINFEVKFQPTKVNVVFFFFFGGHVVTQSTSRWEM